MCVCVCARQASQERMMKRFRHLSPIMEKSKGKKPNLHILQHKIDEIQN